MNHIIQIARERVCRLEPNQNNLNYEREICQFVLQFEKGSLC
jgi:hypothetical protein